MEGDRLKASLTANFELPPRALVLSEIRLLGEGLAQALACDGKVATCCFCTTLQEGLEKIADLRPETVLVDAALPEGPQSVNRILVVEPRTKVVVFAVTETPDNIIAWAEAGVAGYIPRTAAITEIAALLLRIMKGEQNCSAQVAASLLRRLSQPIGFANGQADAVPTLMLTARETQVVELLAAGLSNKHIARRLNIGVATIKSHVHNVLGKLGVQRRSQAGLWMRHHHAGGSHCSPAVPAATRPRA
jgi:two-component system nitrate/nitrite response regulator NarL